MTHSIVKSNQPFSITQFIQARIKRIIPAYATLLIVSTIVAILLLTPHDFQFFKESLKSAVFFTSNHYFNEMGDYFAPSSHEQPLLHTWSLSIEMQFYLLLSLMFILPRKVWKYIALSLFLLSFAFLYYQEYQLAQYQYYSLLSRTSECLLGVILALITYRTQPPRIKQIYLSILSLLSIIVLVTSFFLFSQQAIPNIWIVLIPCFATATLIYASNSPIHRILSTPIFVWIGNLSYSLYLFHWPIIAFMRYLMGTEELSVNHYLIYVLGSISIAYLSFNYIETPIRQFKRKKFFTSTISLLATTGLLILICTKINNSILSPLPIEQTRYANSNLICHGRIIDDCYQGDKSQVSDILVIGDSHAAQLNIFSDYIGKKLGRTLLSFLLVIASLFIKHSQNSSKQEQKRHVKNKLLIWRL